MWSHVVFPFAAIGSLAASLLLAYPGQTGGLEVQIARFTSEAELADPAKAAEIERFWITTGRDGEFTGQRGLHIAFRRFLHADPATERGAIVLVSGRAETMLEYKELVFDLWGAGYSVYLHDHRGQGLSGREAAAADDPEKGHVERFDDYVEDLRRFIGTEVAAGAHRDVFLMAHSMGATVSALLLEGGGPEVRMLRSAVLLSPMFELKGPAGQLADQLLCAEADIEVELGHGAEYIPGGVGYAPASYVTNVLTHSAVRYGRQLQAAEQMPLTRVGDPTKRWAAQSCDAARRARQHARDLRTPVMVLVAGADAVVHPAGAQAFCSAVADVAPASGCDGRGGDAIVIPGARHQLLAESDSMRDVALQRAVEFFAAGQPVRTSL